MVIPGGETDSCRRPTLASVALGLALLLAVSCSGSGSSPEGPDGGQVGDSGGKPGPARVVVMTFNVLCSFCGGREYEPWEKRLVHFKNIIARHDPDLVGAQELLTEPEVKQILEILPGRKALYFRNEQGLKDYADAAIFYRADRFEVVEHGFYWLSPTPDEPWTRGFAKGAQLWRLVAWAHLRLKPGGRDLYFATTHFDNNSPSQEKSAPLVIQRTAPWARKMPVMVTGDFNSQPDDQAYKTLVGGIGGKGFKLVNVSDLVSSPGIVTNKSPKPEYDMNGRIDHLFVAGGSWRCSRWVADLYAYGPKSLYPSDHFPIVATCEF